jgi:phosphatidylserine/phosphatidylglycerophosphate/cardiolipin synthase-like enzyme
MTKRLSLVLGGILALAGCAPSASTDSAASDNAVVAADTCSALSPRTTPLEVFVQPDVGVAPFVDTINRATTSIDVMVYQMGWGPVLDGLIAKAQAGVRVRAILDLAQQHVNQKYKDKLEAAGATVIWSDPKFAFMHAKVMIVDGVEALVSTGNYNQSYMLKERNYAVRDRDAADVRSLQAIFEADFARQDPDLSCTRLIVAPVNARQRLLDFINSAQHTLVIESMQFQDRDVRNAVVARKAAGVDVRVILADPSWIDANTSAATFLQQHGIEPKFYPSAHVKSVVVDGKTAYVGSVNLSWNSIDKNREIGLLVTEQANIDSITATFEHDWTTGTDFPTAPTPAPEAAP